MEAIGESKLRMSAPDALPWSKLTQRERQVLDGIAAGLSNAEMATELFVSVNTIKFHVANVLHKLEVRSRLDAAVLAAVNGRT
ncbi:helix-turn-helix transcriptional regulator [Rhodococcus rhodochrous]|uniref:response regulator transcription factor n=1 Tax=Rhodococcus rhodochrous TaxID=1829 RepID=UPI001E478FCE|nr:helix-turn-helix transcriptional regulator [Rhodococcus rhodochrous]MCB8913977.1 helix-turn-helix transcriptional regulator [Rhodococcus rhodochrous]